MKEEQECILTEDGYIIISPDIYKKLIENLEFNYE